jgi:hypothetical protein
VITGLAGVTTTNSQTEGNDMTDQEQKFVESWAKTQSSATSGLRPSNINPDGTREIRMVFVTSDAYPQQGRTGWKIKEDSKDDAPFTFFNLYPEDYDRIIDVGTARDEGKQIPVVINFDGKGVMLRIQDFDPTHPIAIQRANDLAEGKIDNEGRKLEVDN